MVTESDNIVAETAARIFADLADPQTINRARDDRWKEPLWRALSDAGLTLAWVPEKQGGVRRQPGRRLRDPRRRRPLRLAGAAGGNADRRMAAGARRHRRAGRRDDRRPGPPARPDYAQCRRHFERTRQRNSLRQRLRTHRGRGRRRQGCGDCAWSRPATAASAKAKISPAKRSDSVTFERTKAIRSAPAPADFDASALMLMGATVRSVQAAGALEAILSLSVRYANERVAFERPIGKFQAVQQNLARLAGETAAALAAAGSAADTIAQSAALRRRGLARGRLGENPRRRGRRRRRGHRASGAWRDRLHQRARPASLYASPAVVARRFRQRKLLGGGARRA